VVEVVPEPPRPARVKKERSAEVKPPAESRGAGLETVDRLLAALAADGLVGLGPDKLTLFANAGELVRARKLRRLGNRVLALQRAAESPGSSEFDAASFARLLVDLYLTRQATGAQLEERIALDSQSAEDLLGKTWREAELEPVAGLDLIEVASTTVYDGEFRLETGYFADLPTGAIYVEKLITPIKLATTAPRPRQRCRLLVDDGRLYPGDAPRRIRLGRSRRAPLSLDDVRRLLRRATSSVDDLRQRLVDYLDNPFGPVDLPVLFRPAALITHVGQSAALDQQGRFVALAWPAAGATELPPLLPPGEPYALFGLLDLSGDGLLLRCLSAIGPLAWDRGPFYPDGEVRRR
jgi:hypothetical protein